MILRAFILGLLLWLVWRWVIRPRRRRPVTGKPPPSVQNIVRCARCGLHVPEREALQHAGRYYCSEQHRLEDGDRTP
jgi:uncharacterized protein